MKLWPPQKKKLYTPRPPKHGNWLDYPGELISDKAKAASRDGHLLEIHTVWREVERDLRRRIYES